MSLAWDAAEGGEVDKLLSAKGDRAAAFSAPAMYPTQSPLARLQFDCLL